MSYNLVLRPGVVVTFKLPMDLNQKDAKRIARYVESLAMDEQPALPVATS
jgi:hypothetical protein